MWLALAGVSVTFAGGRAQENPGPLGSGRLVYDEPQRRVLLIDAIATPDASTDPKVLRTWRWDGRHWELLAGTGPVWRVANAAVHDASRRRVVIYGGATIPATTSLAETWETDGGSTWRQRPNGSLEGRDHLAMAFDRARGRTVLFGGGTFVRGQPYKLREETWEWDGLEWRQVAADGPGARRLTGMAYDRSRKQVVLFGGIGPRNAPDLPQPYFNDTWTWNGTTWRKAADGGPPPRYGHAMTFDSRTGVAVIYGGNTVDDQPLADMWQWDGRRWTEIKPPGLTPGARFGAAMVHDAARRRTVLYGGRRDDKSVWEWDGTRWEEIRQEGSAVERLLHRKRAG